MNWLKRICYARRTEEALDAALNVIGCMDMHVNPVHEDHPVIDAQWSRLELAMAALGREIP